MRGIRIPFVLALIAGALPGVATSQELGRITGRVTDRANQAALPGVQVFVAGTQRGAVTDDDGRYNIAGVPPGTVQVRVRRVGYEAASQSVTVAAGATATADFSIGVAAITLEEVVTTATGEMQRKREAGNTVATIDSSKVNLAASQNISQVLSSRAAGVTVLQGSGTTGTPSRIRIRGANSVSLNNEPLLIIDGVRISDSRGFNFFTGGQVFGRLNDINTEDVETIEIIKGPAAAALYGTAAANGVIQITTKRGRPGRTRFNTFAEYGTLEDTYDYPDNFSMIGRRVSDGSRFVNCTIDRQAQRLCTADSLKTFNPLGTYRPYETGWRETFGISAQGGGEQATYYLGGDFERERGVVEPNDVRRVNFRANLNATMSPKLQVQVSTGYLSSRGSLPQNENNALGYISAGVLGKAFNCTAGIQRDPACGADSVSKGFFSRDPKEFFFIRSQQDVERFTGGLTANWQGTSWLRGTFQGGADVVNRTDKTLTEPNKSNWSQGLLEGSRGVVPAQEFTYSANGSLSAMRTFLSDLVSTSTVGAQITQERFVGFTATGAVLLPGTASLGGASARKEVNEVNTDIRTVGAYLRQQLGWRDRLFVTGAIRGDDNSAFGSDFGLVYYPSLSASWVMSDEEFFPRSQYLSQLRLRSAIGRSGQRPGFRQAETFFSPVSVFSAGAERPAAVVGGTGNTKLEPELSTEFEAGFDLGLLDNRFGAEVSYYRKRTERALIFVPIAPSVGEAAGRFVNLGEVENRGFEALLTATPLEMTSVKWDLSVAFSTNRNRLVDLGVDDKGDPLPPIIFNNAVQHHREGFPLGAFFSRRIVSFSDLNGDGILSRVNCRSYGGVANPQIAGGPACEIVLSDSVEYLGANALPTRELSFNTGVTLFRYLRVSALVDHRSGFKQYNRSREFRCASFQNCRDIHDPTAPFEDQAKALASLMGTSVGYVEDADFTKLREVAITVTAPGDWARRMGGQNVSITFAGRNLKTWSDYSWIDPEVNSVPAANFQTTDFFGQAPVRTLTTRVNITF